MYMFSQCTHWTKLWTVQDGYVLGLMSSSLVYSELVKFSYQDTHLLNSIDNEEIPVIIADLLQGIYLCIHALFFNLFIELFQNWFIKEILTDAACWMKSSQYPIEITGMDFLYILHAAGILRENIKSKISDSCDLWLLSYGLLKFRPRGNFWPDLTCLVVTFLLMKISS